MKKRVIVSLMTLSFITFFVGNFFAAEAKPGSDEDPLVTKSFVESKIAQALSGLANTPVETPKNPQTNVVPIPENMGAVENVSSDATAFVPVNLKKDEILKAGEGAEIILRSGKAVAFVPVENGIINVTKGLDLKNNEFIGQNNLIIVPRADGRGIKAKSDVWVIIKGSYDIITQ